MEGDEDRLDIRVRRVRDERERVRRPEQADAVELRNSDDVGPEGNRIDTLIDDLGAGEWGSQDRTVDAHGLEDRQAVRHGDDAKRHLRRLHLRRKGHFVLKDDDAVGQEGADVVASREPGIPIQAELEKQKKVSGEPLLRRAANL